MVALMKPKVRQVTQIFVTVMMSLLLNLEMQHHHDYSFVGNNFSAAIAQSPQNLTPPSQPQSSHGFIPNLLGLLSVALFLNVIMLGLILKLRHDRQNLQNYGRSLEQEIEKREQELDQKIDERIAIERELYEKSRQFSQHYQVLRNLAKANSLHRSDLEVSIQKLTEAAAKNLNVERSSVWLLNEDQQTWNCLDLFLLSTESHVVEPDFTVSDFPKHIDNLQPELGISVNDALNDARTKELVDNYLIQLGITSILEIPLCYNHKVIGIFSLEHTGEPRLWTMLEQTFARSIADLIALAIESYNLILVQQQLKSSEERWQLALEGNNDGIWDWDFKTGYVFYSSRYKTMLGYDESDFAPNNQAWENLVHPDDLQTVIKTRVDYLSGRTANYSLEHRLRCKDGSYKWILARAKVLFDQDGEPIRMVGSHTDITDRRNYEEELQRRANSLSLHNQVLARLAREEELRIGDLQTNIQILNESVAHTLKVERVSFWLAQTDTHYWQCRDVYTLSSHLHGIEPCLIITDYPNYFHALNHEPLLAVSDVLNDKRTHELREYLTARNIKSMLEVPIQRANITIGVLCLEHIETLREWTLEEQSFARSIGDLAIVALESHNRYLIEKQLKESEERWNLALQGTNDGIWDWNCQTNEVFFSQRYKTMLGYSDADIAPTVDSWTYLIHADDFENVMRTVEKYWAGETSQYVAEHRVRCKDGSYRWILARGIAVFNQKGTPTRMIGSHTDITERKQVELDLAQAKEEADSANRAKSEFLANMSHELRTPLNGILGYVQILQRDRNLTPKQIEGINVIKQCGCHLLNLIADILDLSKIEAQKMELIANDFHFLNFLKEIVEICSMRSEQKAITFTYLPSANLPIGVFADEKRLRQVLLNLLGNAIKFTSDGGVTFKVKAIAAPRTDAHERGFYRVCFEVEDTGVGIDQEHLQKIFSPFEQAGNQQSQFEGTGLGLAISQKIAEFMGSSIYVRSEIGKGSVFGLEVDLAAADEDFAGRWSSHQNTQRKIIGVKGKTYKILLVDDKWENRTVLVNLLEEIGFEIIEASQGQEALELAKSEHPDLIITDLVMPVMDGFEMMRHLRRSPDLCDIIIIVTSASAFSKDATQSLETGGNDFIAKPVSFDLLLAKIEKHLNLEWIYEDITTIPINNHCLANSARSPDATISPLSVVVPDDEDINILFDLAMQGNINGILEYAIAIEQKDDQLVPFAKELQNLANEFKIKQIKELVKSLRNKPS